MILITVGTQFPFDRLVSAIDDWCQNKQVEVIAQVGESSMIFNNLKAYKNLSPAQFDQYLIDAELVVSHAGMGTIINCLLKNKPVIIMPRDSDLGEHRNQHQRATCSQFSQIDGIYVAYNVTDLVDLLNARSSLRSGGISDENIKFSKALAEHVKAML